jgi:hypothetical protein
MINPEKYFPFLYSINKIEINFSLLFFRFNEILFSVKIRIETYSIGENSF